ncbi:hypothetical protein [Nostoc sp. DedQUE07]|nr:hypothetical protein [Nostoc sp. DedQUE07]MDZ8132023.1 hypothetical protein [Nostoc sp. DedQUE07]
MKRREVFNTAAIATATAASLVSCSQAGKSPLYYKVMVVLPLSDR